MISRIFLTTPQEHKGCDPPLRGAKRCHFPTLNVNLEISPLASDENISIQNSQLYKEIRHRSLSSLTH